MNHAKFSHNQADFGAKKVICHDCQSAPGWVAFVMFLFSKIDKKVQLEKTKTKTYSSFLKINQKVHLETRLEGQTWKNAYPR